jgi:hypothetical protein
MSSLKRILPTGLGDGELHSRILRQAQTLRSPGPLGEVRHNVTVRRIHVNIYFHLFIIFTMTPNVLIGWV